MDASSVLLQQLPAYPSSSIDSSSTSDAPSLSRQYDLMAHLERLKEFLATAPTRWSSSDAIPISQQHPALNRFLLPSNEYVTCVNWCNVHYITGTDIVRALVFRFEAFGRPVRNMKKFEEGVFSDLRNLKPGQDACLEDPKSPFLDLLFKYQCIRTQKKQKVFFWFSVPHDRLFIDALERDLKREKIGLESTTAVVAEPALSFSYDPKRPLFEQINASTLSALTQDPRSNGLHPHPHPHPNSHSHSQQQHRVSLRGRAGSISLPDLKIGTSSMSSRSSLESPRSTRGDGSSDILPNPPASTSQSPMSAANSPTDVTSSSSRGNSFFNMFSFLEGTPTYKQRRKKAKPRRNGGCSISGTNSNNDDDRMRYSLEIHTPRRSFDIAPRNHLTNVAGPGRHSLDSLQNGNGNGNGNATTTGGNNHFLNGGGSSQYGFPAHLGAQQMRVHNLPAPITAAPRPRQAAPGIARHALTTPEYICPFHMCRQAFSFQAQLYQHMLQHSERSGCGGPNNGMDVDPEGQRQQHYVHTAQHQHQQQPAPVPPTNNNNTNGTATAHYVSIPRNVSGSPEIPTFSHVLTTPNGSPRYEYDYDDDCGYAPDWSHQHQQQQQQLHHPAANANANAHAHAKIEEDQEHSIPVPVPNPNPQPISVAPQPMYPHQQQQLQLQLQQHQQQQHQHAAASAYAFDTTSVASVSSTSPSYPPPSPTYPVSAPADQLTFNIPDIPPNDADSSNDNSNNNSHYYDSVSVQNRRPRSATPPNSQPVPPRATHRRRPSTATAVLTTFGGGSGLSQSTTDSTMSAFNVARSNSFTSVTLAAAQQQQQQQQQLQQQLLPPSSWRTAPRGYHPYAAPDHGLSTRPSTSYSTSSAPSSSQGSSSPFAVHINVNAPSSSSGSGNEYGHSAAAVEGGRVTAAGYLQQEQGQHEVKYEPQEYCITHEAEYVEYASYDAAAAAGNGNGEQGQGYVEGGNGVGEYVSEETSTTAVHHSQGYPSEELSPEVQFAHVAVSAYPEEDYDIAHAHTPAPPASVVATVGTGAGVEAGPGPGSSDRGYTAHVEDVYGATAEYQCVHDISMSPEEVVVAASYAAAGHEQTYSMQTSSHTHQSHHQHEQHLHHHHSHHHPHHHPHHDAQMLPYYQQQVA